MRFRDTSSTGMFITFVSILLSAVAYFLTPLWNLVVGEMVKAIFSEMVACKAFKVVWILWLALPFGLFGASISGVRRTRDEATICALIGFLVPTDVFCGLVLPEIVNSLRKNIA